MPMKSDIATILIGIHGFVGDTGFKCIEAIPLTLRTPKCMCVCVYILHVS